MKYNKRQGENEYIKTTYILHTQLIGLTLKHVPSEVAIYRNRDRNKMARIILKVTEESPP